MASVLDAIRDGVSEVFTELATVTQAVGYMSANPGGASYSVTTGTVTPSFTTFSVAAFVLDFKHREYDGDRIRVGDKRLMVERANAELSGFLAGTAFGPKLNDRVLINGIEHLVISWETDPANATVSLQVRRAL